MLQFSKFQTALILGVVLLGALFAVPNFFSDEELANMPGVMPKSQINLGLDLQGGSYLLLDVDTDKAIGDKLKVTRQEIQREMRPNRARDRDRIKLAGGRVTLNEQTRTISLRLEDPSQMDDALARLRDATRGAGTALGARPFEIVRKEGAFDVRYTPEAARSDIADILSATMTVIRRRIDPAGNKEVSIQPQGEKRIVVQVPGDNDPERLKKLLGEEGQLSFHRHDLSVAGEDAATGLLPPGRIYVPFAESEGPGGLVLYEDPVITGDSVRDAAPGVDNQNGGFLISFSFDGRGARRFGDFSSEHIGERFAIVLDGQIITAPVIQGAIMGGQGQITGNFTAAEAGRIATLIKAGSLPAPLQIVEQRSVGPELGRESIEAGILALIVGFVAVVIYMVVAYGRFGIYADIALIANVILIAGALSLFGSTLTLPGIAGIVLTVGMAVDANVLIFERIREELRGGKGPVKAVEIGYEKARSAILDANITTFLAALIMFFLGAGPVRGFAVTLAVGVVTSVFTAYVLTRIFAGGFVLGRRPQTISL